MIGANKKPTLIDVVNMIRGQSPTGGSFGNLSNNELMMMQQFAPTNSGMGNVSDSEMNMFKSLLASNNESVPMGNVSDAEMAAFQARAQIMDNYNSALGIVNNTQLPPEVRNEAVKQIQIIKEAYPQLFTGQ